MGDEAPQGDVSWIVGYVWNESMSSKSLWTQTECYLFCVLGCCFRFTPCFILSMAHFWVIYCGKGFKIEPLLLKSNPDWGADCCILPMSVSVSVFHASQQFSLACAEKQRSLVCTKKRKEKKEEKKWCPEPAMLPNVCQCAAQASIISLRTNSQVLSNL